MTRSLVALLCTMVLVAAAGVEPAVAAHASARSDAGDGRLRLLLVRGEAGAAHRVGRHHRRRHAAHEHADGLARAGVPDDKIQASLKAIVAAFPHGSAGRGPGGHILTGPVYVEGAEPGDVLEVKVLSIDLPIDYGYNGCSGFLRENCDRADSAREDHSRSIARR